MLFIISIEYVVYCIISKIIRCKCMYNIVEISIFISCNCDCEWTKPYITSGLLQHGVLKIYSNNNSNNKCTHRKYYRVFLYIILIFCFSFFFFFSISINFCNPLELDDFILFASTHRTTCLGILTINYQPCNMRKWIYLYTTI